MEQFDTAGYKYWKHELPRAYGTGYSPEFSPHWPF